MKRCAAGLLFKDNQILLGKRTMNRKFYPNVWDLIGGHCKKNENVEQALSRELQEEIDVIPTKYVHITILHEPEPEIHGKYDYHIFLVTEWLGFPKNKQSNEHSELRWFEINDAEKLDLAHQKYPD